MTNNIFSMNMMRPKTSSDIALFLNIWLEWENYDAGGEIGGFTGEGAKAMNGGKMSWEAITSGTGLGNDPSIIPIYVGFSDANDCPGADGAWNVGRYKDVFYKVDWFGATGSTWDDAVHKASCGFGNFYGAEGGTGYGAWADKTKTMIISASAKWVCMGTEGKKIAFGKVTSRMGKRVND